MLGLKLNHVSNRGPRYADVRNAFKSTEALVIRMKHYKLCQGLNAMGSTFNQKAGGKRYLFAR